MKEKPGHLREWLLEKKAGQGRNGFLADGPASGAASPPALHAQMKRSRRLSEGRWSAEGEEHEDSANGAQHDFEVSGRNGVHGDQEGPKKANTTSKTRDEFPARAVRRTAPFPSRVGKPDTAIQNERVQRQLDDYTHFHTHREVRDVSLSSGKLTRGAPATGRGDRGGEAVGREWEGWQGGVTGNLFSTNEMFELQEGGGVELGCQIECSVGAHFAVQLA